jgi:TonB family protein
MYGRKETGTGAASAGFSDKAFGRDFAWYADRLTAAVTQYWTPAPGATSTPRVYVTFTVNKDGTVRDLEFEKKSNNDALDNSAKRAVMQAAANQKIPPLPPDFRGSSIKVRLSFEYIVR